MTDVAILFMTSSVLFVTALVGWCYYRVLMRPGRREDNQEQE